MYVSFSFLNSTVSSGLLYFFFFFFLSVLNGSRLPHDCYVNRSPVIVISPVKWLHMIGKTCDKPSKLRQNQGIRMASQVGVPPLTGLIFDFCSALLLIKMLRDGLVVNAPNFRS